MAESTNSPDHHQTNDSHNNQVLYAIGASTSIVVSGTFFVALAYYRDALMITFFMGAIGNAVLGKILKRILNQERPQELDTVDMKLKPSDKGMPSSHAMSLGFIGTFTGLVVPIPGIQIPILIYSLISLWYRIDTKLHTWQQIAVGFVVGTTNGVIWKLLCDGNSNPWNINLLDVVRQNLLNEQGVLPMVYLAVPALVGLIVVGSVERRLSGWIKQLKQTKEEGDAIKSE
ncbi:PAP2 superfamily [Seminavis robusta]|uniref:PAP2 superfamily n=1 Tax=Seminavis robusta TaxID=568900 RepID=A0A9N8HVF5_9STRA|nr:PAP2 superfamily [Seminavis robusta]|eukprot:Sro1797_g298160.1 PAP2 superfamily (230) ;mRNA; f:7030-7719